MLLFNDHRDAGQALAGLLAPYAGRKDCVVIGIARRGVLIGEELSRRLRLPLDVVAVRKLGAPGNESLALGAIAPDGICVLNEEIVTALGVTQRQLMMCEDVARQELEKMVSHFDAGLPLLHVKNRTAILVDDTIATGASLRAALEVVRRREPRSIVLSSPIASIATCRKLERIAGHLQYIVEKVPDAFYGTSNCYSNFGEVDDHEIISALHRRRTDD